MSLDIEQISALNLPKLTPPQRRFVQSIERGDKIQEAIQEAYPKRFEGKNKSYMVREGRKLLTHHKVKAWLDFAEQAGVIASKCTLSEHLASLKIIRDMAIKAGHFSAAVNAEAFRGRAAGHYIERVEVTTKQSPLAIIEKIAKIDVKLAKHLAEERGIEFQPEDNQPIKVDYKELETTE